MADPVASTTVTMLLMFFVAAPADVQSAKDKATAERTVAWTLQSTQQVETPDADMCNRYADKVVALIDPVATMTVRVYCLCPFTETVVDKKTHQKQDKCVDDPEHKNPELTVTIQKLRNKFPPGIQVIGPNFPH